MNPYLGSFPEMTEAELSQFHRHHGHFTVSWYEPKVKSLVAAKYCSIACFLDKNDFPDDPAVRALIEQGLNHGGKFEVMTKYGTVGIYC